MCKKVTALSALLLGAIFIFFGLNFFLNFIPVDAPAEGSLAAAYIGALYTSGLLAFIKILEVLGGLLVALPKTRKLGLLILLPIIVNIVAYNSLIAKDGFHMDVALVAVLALFLIIKERTAFLQLIKPSECCDSQQRDGNNSCQL
tara:strand:- start:7665 stop:8099 length:435 start_codon:yes stop_codon:yes gene_type:complete